MERLAPDLATMTLTGRNCLLVFVLICAGASPALRAGTNGILEGVVDDKETGEMLPGVNVVLSGLNLGTVTDEHGYYKFGNLRAGRYEVRFSLIGYQAYTLKNVVINPDLRTRLNASLNQSD